MTEDETHSMKKETRIKRLSAAVMLAFALFMLSGCMGQVTQRPLEDIEQIPMEVDAQAPEGDLIAPQEMLATLYFLDEEGMHLIPVTRSITAHDGMARSEAALYALLGGPLPEEEAFWPEIGLLGTGRVFELSGGVATVDLPARLRALGPEELFALRLAITHTLTEFAEISYVNVLIGGREEGFDLAATMPVGTLSRAEDLDVAARYLRQEEVRQGAQNAGLTRMTTLYFPSLDGRYILPQVRAVSYAALAPIEYLYTLLEEIGKGPDNALCMEAPPPMKYIEEMPEIVRTEDGAYRAIEIRLDESIDEALEAAGLTRGAYLAMLTETLMGFVPGVEGLLVRIGGEQVTALLAEETPDGRAVSFTQTLATRVDFSGYVGAPGVICVPEKDNGKLVKETCVFAQAQQSSPRARLLALTGRLVEIGALGDGLTNRDILAVSGDESRILVNLSEAYAQALSELTPAQERAAVYAMVNTLTEGASAERVAFFFEGEQVQTLAGELEMRGEFLRNPGMVVAN